MHRAAFLLIAFAALVWPSAAASTNEQPSDAKIPFTFSDDATAVVLYVGMTSPMTSLTMSMAVHGDGRIELRNEKRASGIVMGTYEVQVERAEVEALLRIAVDHGLLDWDSASMSVRQLQTGRRFTGGNIEATSIDLIFVLKTYGDRGHAGREIHGLQDIRSARRLYPDFPEYKGIYDLLQYMVDAYRQAGGGQ